MSHIHYCRKCGHQLKDCQGYDCEAYVAGVSKACIKDPGTDIEDDEGLKNPVAVIQARPATRKLVKGLRRSGVVFRRLHCVPVKEGGCGLAVVIAESGLSALKAAEADGGRVDVVCDRCIERYLGIRRALRNDLEFTEEQIKEGSKVARILDVQERRN